MDRAAFRQRFDRRQFFTSYGTETVWRDAERCTGKPIHHGLGAMHEPFVTVERMDETFLTVDRRLTAETGMRIKYRQQSQADTRLRGGGTDTFGHFGDIAVM
ncbi:hypothetical protein D3C87_1825300 [compost metagenome]